MRLIDAEALEKIFEERIAMTGIYGGVIVTILKASMEVLLKDVKSQPTIEAKPVVFCKDCKHNVANAIHDPLDITDYTDIVCEYFMTDGMSPDDFCSNGIKMDEEVEDDD